jgi:phenylpropionate dioxygenase-like ring-hydroxylating dioxygenase large terminal subunit
MIESAHLLRPPSTKGHVSVARLSRYWYVGCRSADLRRGPLGRTVLGVPLVLFRGAGGQAGALLDRCPHRNVPLSLGRVLGSGQLECAYHGWQFDVAGACRLVPGLCSDADGKQRRVDAYPVREQDGFVWVCPSLEVPAMDEPFRFPQADRPDYQTVVREVRAEATLHATVENALDVPHTAYLHRGLFRGGKKNEIQVVVRRGADLIDAEYLGEPRPAGIAGRLLSPSGGVVEHHDRFFLPSIAQVEYRLGSENHFIVTSACTPVTDFSTRLFAVVSFRTRLPGWLVRPLLEPFALRIFRQDAAILKAQSDNIRRFGGEQYMSTEIDVLGPHIWRLMRQAERGELAYDATRVAEREVVQRLTLFA